MGWNEEHKSQSRDKILVSAAKLFTRYGYEHIGINDVMKDAGMTRGAFYNHFSSKGELYQQAILKAAKTSRQKMVYNSEDQADALLNQYLSMCHRQGDEFHCPLAFLATDIHQRDEAVRTTYTNVFQNFIRRLSQGEITGKTMSEQQALSKSVLMIGAVAIARAVNDEALAEKILIASRQAVREF